MKRLNVLAVIGMVLLASCSKGVDYVGPEPTPTPTPAPTEDPKTHAEEVLGFIIPSDQDWITTTKGSINVNVAPTVKKVAIMALVSQTDEDGEAFNSMTVLNEVATNNQSSLTINYDAPSKIEKLYAAFYTDSECIYKEIEGNSVAFSRAAMTRGTTDVFSFPEGDFKIASTESSYASQRAGYLVNGVTDRFNAITSKLTDTVVSLISKIGNSRRKDDDDYE